MLVEDMINVPLGSLVVLPLETPAHEARKILDNNGRQTGLVVNEKGCLLGQVRRAKLPRENSGKNLLPFMEAPGKVVCSYENAGILPSLFEEHRLQQIYVIDQEEVLVGAISANHRGLKTFGKINDLLPVSDIFDAIHDAIIIIDETATIVYVNHAYSRIVGVKAGRILGKNMRIVEPTSLCLGVLEGDPPIINQRIRIQSIGVEVLASITPIYRGEKKVGVVSVFRNIDETIRLSIELQRMKGVAHYLQQELELKNKLPSAFESLVGRNSRFLDALALAARVAPTDATVMIRGENGVGKGVLAQAIHKSSARQDRPLIKVNCAAIPEQLLESELFGYEEGAFTGARKGGQIGKFELADRGTLFLDEISDMSLAMQAKLLKATQEKEIEKVGGSRPIKVDVRIISATNKDLEAMVAKKTFREDLYYRLNVMPIILPPLRERKDDIPLLAEHFIKQYCREQGKKEIFISPQVMDIFLSHKWPGNIRELQNAVEHGAILCGEGVMTPEHLPWYLKEVRAPGQTAQGDQFMALPKLIARVEKEAIRQALRMHNNNKSAAIKALGISRRTFYEKLKKYGLA
ncbi:MAG: sigma 54-interacting transcriptional regulator [Bacillota bacterium]